MLSFTARPSLQTMVAVGSFSHPQHHRVQSMPRPVFTTELRAGSCRGATLAQAGCCGEAQPHEGPLHSEATPASNGCGCNGNGNGAQEQPPAGEAATQGVIQAFDNLLGGPEGRLRREDFAVALETPLGEAGDGQERFWDIADILADAPANLVFEHDGEEELDALIA